MDENGKFVELNINDILPNRFQPRIYFNEKKLNELATSIDKHGVIQPIIVRPVNNKYEIISGERRYKASKLANKATIPAIIRVLSDRDSEEIALLENVQRQDLTPIEEAVSYKRILDSGYMTQEELAKKIGKSQPTIANKVRLLNLDDTVQEALLYGKISERHARSLLKLTNRVMQRNILNIIINERLTVRRADEEIAKELKNINQESPVNKIQTNVEPPANVLKTSGIAENLFEEEIPKQERKEGFMDIDKIMREAKDINTEEKQTDISQLMNQEPSMKPEPNVLNQAAPMPQMLQENRNSQPLVNDDNKFVHYIPTEQEPVKPQTAKQTTGVSFNSIFNSTPADLVPNTKPMTQEVSSVSPENKSTAEPNISSTPKVENENNNPIASAVSAAFEAAANSVNNQSHVEINNTTEPMNQNINNVVTPAPINNPVNTENVVSESPIVNELDTFANNNGSFSQVSDNIPVINNQPERQPESITPPPIKEQPNINMMNDAPSVSSLGLDTPNINETPTQNNLPTEPIFEDNIADTNQDIQPSMISTPTKAVNVNNFSNIIHLIRECADKIEALGYNINLDEVDLDNNYQVTFTINK